MLGVYQSASSASRFVGQAGSGTLYGQLGMNAPFLLGAIAMLPALLLTGRIRRGLQAAPAQEPVGSEAR